MADKWRRNLGRGRTQMRSSTMDGGGYGSSKRRTLPGWPKRQLRPRLGLEPRDGEEFCHRGRVGVPGGLFALETPASFGSQMIVFRAAIVAGDSPLGLDPVLRFHAVERRIERAFLYE